MDDSEKQLRKSVPIVITFKEVSKQNTTYSMYLQLQNNTTLLIGGILFWTNKSVFS